jgi:uncharacterized protein (TIGR02246 family)
MAAQTPHELLEAFAAAINRRELDAAGAMWTEDAAIVASDGSLVRGREAIVRALEALVGNGTRFEVELAGIYEAGDTALVTGTLILSGDGHDGPYEHRGESTVVYSRGPDGTWRIALDAPWGLPSRSG